MIMPSFLTWVIGAAVVVALAVVLRTVANEAQELARSRALVRAEHANGNTSRKAA
jgi:predicted transcriptional regulator